MPEKTIYWYDFESFGGDPRRDRASQFAGMRTDENLEAIGEPLMLHCRPAPDFLPDAMACLITGITPQTALEKGVAEAEFIARIREQFARPGTCVAGYNNIRFDDELTRQLLYRNFFDAYEHEWRDGNSRWDIIDMARLCAAIRPEGINWPRNDEGAVTFRLEALCRANGIQHENAHDALSDVEATVALARLIRDRQPRLYAYAYQLRHKDRVEALIDLASHKPILHVSGRYPARLGCLALAVPVGAHPRNKNGVVVYDLRVDPRQWAGMSDEQLGGRLFASRQELDELGGERLPLKVLSRNRCPIVASPAVLPAENAAAFGIDRKACGANWEYLTGNPRLMRRFCKLFGKDGFGKTEESDPDYQLYGGGFFSDSDRSHMETLRKTAPGELGRYDFPFRDQRLPEMLFRYRARNYPDTLSAEEQERWREFRHGRLTDPAASERYRQSLDEAAASDLPGGDTVLPALEAYVADIRASCAGAG
ncbi:MAG: exodeoxyribonuclease I [Gammaproteobacteria bacterium]|nr:exodeoxyribonuclease I [Gammaproteobacteria bacterium]